MAFHASWGPLSWPFHHICSLREKKQNTKTTSCFSSTMLSIKACICWLCYFVYQNGDTAVATALALISLNLLLHWMQINIATNGFQAVSLLQLPPLHSCAALFFGTSSYYWGGFNWSPSFLHASVIKTALREHSQFQNCNINKLEHPWIRQHRYLSQLVCPWGGEGFWQHSAPQAHNITYLIYAKFHDVMIGVPAYQFLPLETRLAALKRTRRY